MPLTWWVKSFKTQITRKNMSVVWLWNCSESQVKKVGDSLENPSLHFTKQNLVTLHQKAKTIPEEICTPS